jgi:CoA-transferase family III
VALHDAQKLEDELSKLGLCAAVVRSPEEWRAHPQGLAIADAPPIELVKLADGPPVGLERAAFRPLERLRVLDFTHVVAGPTIGKLLAEHGAHVIHCRYPYLDHVLGFDIDTSFGKKNTYLDLRSDDDRARALELVRGCDVFVQGFRWGSFARHGFGPEDLRRINPRLIYVEVNAYGFQGPGPNVEDGSNWRRRRPGSQPCTAPRQENRRRSPPTSTTMATPIAESELGSYLVDQDSPIGLLTRVAPAIQLDKTPAYVDRAGSFPGSSTLDIGWGPDVLAPHAVPHRPTSIFRLGVAHMRGRQVL